MPGSTSQPIQPATRRPSSAIARMVSRAWLMQPVRRPTTSTTGSRRARATSAWSSVGDSGAAQPPTPSTISVRPGACSRSKASSSGASSTLRPSAIAASSGASGRSSA